MSSSHSDLNLLFAVLALQNDLVVQEDLLAAMNAWIKEKHRPLGEILVERGAMLPEDRRFVEPLMQWHLERFGSAEQTLAVLNISQNTRDLLAHVADVDVQDSLATIPLDSNSADAAPRSARSAPGIRYRVIRPHAKGGLGEVFLAEDLELRREVALKEIKQKYADHDIFRGRFVLEAEITGGLEHPGIVPVYGLGAYPDGRPYYAMRFIRGETLQAAIARFHTSQSARFDALEFRQLLGRFVDICNAVGYAHSRGVLHRDLKPANVMLGKFGETLVVDWGLAKVAGRAITPAGADKPDLISVQAAVETHAGAAIGTPGFMSPEQAAGKVEELAAPTDIYSLGAVLYSLLTNEPPLWGRDVADILKRAQQGDIDWKHRTSQGQPLPRPLAAICRKAMALSPGDRFASALDLAADVEHYLADEPVSAHRESALESALRFGRRYRAWVSAAALALIAISVASTIAAALIDHSRRVAVNLAKENGELAKSERAAKELAQEAERNRKAQYAQSLFEAGQLARERGNWRQSIKLLDSAIEAGCADPTAATIDIALMYYRLEERERVGPLLARIRAAGTAKQHPRYLHLEAMARFMRSDGHVEASRFLQESLASETLSDADRAFMEGMLANTFGAALEKFEAAVRADSRHIEARRMLILLSAMLSQTERARRHIEALELIAPEVPVEDFDFWVGVFSGDQALVTDSLIRMESNSTPAQLNTNRSIASFVGQLRADFSLDSVRGPTPAALLKSLPSLLSIFANADTRFYSAFVLPVNHPAFNRMPALAREKLIRDITFRDSSDLLEELADIFPDALFTFVIANDRLGKIGWGAALQKGPEAVRLARLKLKELESLLLKAQGQKSIIDGVDRRVGALLLHVRTLILWEPAGPPADTQAVGALAKQLYAYMTAFPEAAERDTERMNLIMAAELVGDYVLARRLIEQWKIGGYQLPMALQYQLKIEVNHGDPWTQRAAAKAVLSHDPHNEQGRRALDWAQSQISKAVKEWEPAPATEMATLYRATGKIDLAMPFLEEAFSTRRAKLGPDHPETLSHMTNLATAQLSFGKQDAAVALLLEALDRRRAKLGAEHPGTLKAMRELAKAYRLTGRLDESKRLLEEMLLRCRKLKLVPEQIAEVEAELGIVHFEAEQWNEAIMLFEEARAKVGARASLRWIASWLETAYRKTGQQDKAEALRRTQNGSVTGRLSIDDPTTAGSAIVPLALKLLEQRKPTGAELLLDDCLAIRERSAPDHWTTFNTRSMLGESLFQQGDLIVAAPLLEVGYEGMKAREKDIPPAARVHLAAALERLVELYDRWERPAYAAKWQKELDAHNAAK